MTTPRKPDPRPLDREANHEAPRNPTPNGDAR